MLSGYKVSCVLLFLYLLHSGQYRPAEWALSLNTFLMWAFRSADKTSDSINLKSSADDKLYVIQEFKLVLES